jgi:hypothetical protein
MSISVCFRKFLPALLVCSLSACASMQSVDVGSAMRDAPPPGVDIGSLVEVVTLDDRKMKFRITDISRQGLNGKYGFVAYEDMARLRVESMAARDGKAAGYVLGVLGFVALAALIDSADSVRICSSPPCE